VINQPKVKASRGALILPLTSLRFFAAFYVVLYHTYAAAGPPDYSSWLVRFLGTGYISVSFFFTLSGYILAAVYLRDDGQLRDRTKFWIARFARVYPLFFLTLVLDTPNLLLDRIAKYGLSSAIAKTGATFVANCFMLQSWILKLRGIDNPNWSLSVETVFYLLFPFIGATLWRSSWTRAWWALIAIYLCGSAAVLLSEHAGVNLDVLKFNPLFHLHEFAAGILIARLQTGFSSGCRTLVHRFAPALAVLSIGALLLCVQFKEYLSYPLIHDGFLVPFYGLLLWAFASGNQSISAVFSRPWLVLLGEASYGMYLLHYPLFHIYERTGFGSIHPQVSYGIYLAFTIALSVMVFRYIETPARGFILRRLNTYTKETTLTSALAQ
jgi:peptidoglycan/LPS O-acetylase OafA/YrhL